jgi:hypothetical protein
VLFCCWVLPGDPRTCCRSAQPAANRGRHQIGLTSVTPPVRQLVGPDGHLTWASFISTLPVGPEIVERLVVTVPRP